MTETAPPQTAANTARIRVSAETGTHPVDVSDGPFLMANPGTEYYVNDGSTSGDGVTTAIGSHTASGKSPDQPVASLATLIAAYDLDPGDTIHVDAGAYPLPISVQVKAADAGVRISGPAAASAVFDRQNFDHESSAIEINADDVTIERLAVTGAAGGIMAGLSASAARVQILNNRVFANASVGIVLGDSLDGLAQGNEVYGRPDSYYDQEFGISLFQRGQRAIGNRVHDNGQVGILASFHSFDSTQRIVVTGNVVFNNGIHGIRAENNVLVVENTIYGQTALGGAGIELLRGGARAENNTVYANEDGIAARPGTIVVGNSVFGNANIGIFGDRGQTVIEHNRAYSNRVGMDRTISSATLLLTRTDESVTTSRPWKVPPTLRMRFESVRCMLS